MSIKVNYEAKDYDPAKPYKRYIKYVAGTFYWCEAIAMNAYDARQGTVDQHELTDEFRNSVVDASFRHTHYVDWPA